MTGLLVSVRSVAEARIALDAGVDVLDVKEPANGALGMASAEVLRDIQRLVGKKMPLSMAAGEMGETDGPLFDFRVCWGYQFLKWGPAGLNGEIYSMAWGCNAERLLDRIGHQCQLVCVAYADHEDANSLPPETTAGLAVSCKAPLLIDTFTKRSNLLDCMPIDQLRRIREQCHAAGVKIALAGSLGRPEMEQLLPLRPDWFGVRGAVCTGGRGGDLDAERLHALLDWLRAARRTSPPLRVGASGGREPPVSSP